MPEGADGDTMPELLGESGSRSGDRLSLLGFRLGGWKPSSVILHSKVTLWSAHAWPVLQSVLAPCVTSVQDFGGCNSQQINK